MATRATFFIPPIVRPQSQVEGNAIANRILIDLPEREAAVLYPQLAFVETRSRDVLQECEDPVKYAYFMESGVASVLNLTEEGRSVEVGILGKEGCTGLLLAVGLKTSACRVVVQTSGAAFRISAGRLVAALYQCPQLQMRIQRYGHILAMQSAQFACCNQLHDVDKRLARWLLMIQDRIESNIIEETQEFIAHMLGTRRSSVNIAAGLLQDGGMIASTRGVIKVVDRNRLEEASCECYQLIRKRTEVWNEEAS